MPFQFLNEPLTKAIGGTVTMVLSKFCTFTVVRLISVTMPSAPALSTVIQSPTCSISLDVRRIPATRPCMVSWKTSIRPADVAPSPASKVMGLRSIMIETVTTTARKATMIRTTPKNERIYCCLLVRRPLSNSFSWLMNVKHSRTVANVR